MAVLQKGKAIYPFWGVSINLITGLDPLSLQTTSEATYATMLPGISNLTNRLRYYGFYCWLLDFYFKKICLLMISTLVSRIAIFIFFNELIFKIFIHFK